MGVMVDEDKAKFEMVWQKEKKIEDKLKLIQDQYKGDGSLFLRNEVFHIWEYNPKSGATSRVQNVNFRKMPDAINHFIKYCTTKWTRKIKDWDTDFLLVASNTPLLSSAEWKSPTNMIMIGKAAAYRDILLRKTIINESLKKGKDFQYYAVLKDKKSEAVKLEAMGINGAEVTKKFDTKCNGAKATHTGVLYHANGNIYRIAPADPTKIKDPIHKGENDALVAFAEFFMKNKKMWAAPVKVERDAKIVLKSEEDKRLSDLKGGRKEIAQRMIAYGQDLKDNFNGTGYRFQKNELFRGVRYNIERDSVTYWNFYAMNMDKAYEAFGNTLISWGKRNFANTNYESEEYFLFGGDRLLLSTLEVAKPVDDGTNIT